VNGHVVFSYNTTANPTAATLNTTKACCARGANPPLVLFAGFDVEVDAEVEVPDVGTVIYWIEDDFEGGIEAAEEEAGTDPAAADEEAGTDEAPLPAREVPPTRLEPLGELYGGAVACVGSTYEPVPHGKAAPPGCVAFVGGVVAPDAEAIVNRPVHVSLVDDGDENW